MPLGTGVTLVVGWQMGGSRHVGLQTNVLGQERPTNNDDND